jgi:hypothetical protein
MFKPSHVVIFLIMSLFCSYSLSFSHFHDYVVTFATMLQLYCINDHMWIFIIIIFDFLVLFNFLII